MSSCIHLLAILGVIIDHTFDKIKKSLQLICIFSIVQHDQIHRTMKINYGFMLQIKLFKNQIQPNDFW